MISCIIIAHTKKGREKIMAIQNILKKSIAKAFLTSEGDALDLTKLNFVHILKGFGTAVLSFILGSAGAAFGSYPFGIAYLAAVNRFPAYSWLGLLISALFNRGNAVAAATVYTVCIALRYALCKLKLKNLSDSDRLFDETVLLRCTVSCFAAFVFGLYRLISGGFLYYDLFGLLAGFFISPLTTLALAGLFTKREQLSKYAEISSAVLMFITVFSLREYNIFGFSPAFAAAFFVTLWTASSAGALRGCAVGLLSGLACGTAMRLGEVPLSYSVAAAPCILAAAGLTVGVLWKYAKIIAAAAGCVAAMTLGASMDGFTILQRLLPDALGAAAIFLPLSYYGVMPRLPVFAQPDYDKIGEEALIMEKKQNDTVLRMNSLSQALGRLSDVIYTLSDRLRRPGIIDLKQVCDTSFDRHCRKCSLASLCWERECTSTLDAQSKITTELYKSGRIELADIPGYIRERCYNIEKIAAQINLGVAELVERLIKDDKTEAFAIDYEALSKLLAESVSANDEEYKIDEELTKKLRRSLRYMDIAASRALCYGKRKKQIIIGGVDLSRVRMGADEIRRAVENTVRTHLTSPRFQIEENTVTVTLTARRRFRVENAKATSVKESESANGDTAAMFENQEDYFYTLISDGMGSGREAAITSKLCAVFCEQMLSGGNGKAVTLEMLNGFIRSRASECSATIDLCEIDMITGEACFVKSGAAPSYVLRNGNLYKLQSKTVPIGILSAIDAEKIRFDLKEDDIIIMLSDGVAQSLEDGIWLANLLTYEWEDNLQIMADKILDNAALSNKRSDDMTVALVRVSGNDGEEDES